MEKYNEATMKKHLGDTQAAYTDKINKAEKTLFDNTDELNTAIKALPGDNTPVASDGTAGSAGIAGTLSRSDHKHPSDASKLNVEPIPDKPLLDSAKKINTYYLPDSILGQVRYCGTWDASSDGATNATFSEQAKPTESSIWVPRAGDYFICTKGGKYSPSGFGIKAIAASDNNYYQPGDWALINSVSSVGADTVPDWGKIDNTDAVRSVNNQIGDVKTYKDVWAASTQYRVGDFVQKDNVLYICIQDAKGDGVQPTTDITNQYWKPCGSVISINGKKGVVNIWRDVHNKNEEYKAGDLVRQGTTSDIYVCLKDTAKDSGIELTNTEHWRITGKVYTNAQAPSDGNPGNDGLMSKEDKAKLDELVVTGAAVKSVNGYTGDVKTYKGQYTTGKICHQGDIVLFGGDLYLCIQDADATININNTSYYKIFGKVYTNASTSAPGLMSTTDKTRLDSLYTNWGSTTPDEVGKVKDVTVNGTSVLGANGIAAITLEALAAEYVTVTSTDSSWVDKTIQDASGSNVTYKAIRVQKTDTALCVFNSAGQEIIVQKIYEGDYLYLCVGTSAINCTIRKLKGNSTGTGGSGGGSGSGDVTAAGDNIFTGSNTFNGAVRVNGMPSARTFVSQIEGFSGYAAFGSDGKFELKSNTDSAVYYLQLPYKSDTLATLNDIPTVTTKYLHQLYITGSDDPAGNFTICAMYVSNSDTAISTFAQLLSALASRQMMATGYCGGSNTTKPVYCLQQSRNNGNFITIHTVTNSGDGAVDINPNTISDGNIADNVIQI